MAEPAESEIYVFTKTAVIRSIRKLENSKIHEHFAGYLAILRALKNNNGQSIRLTDIVDFHDRYLRVEGASDNAPYVRPFKSRGKGLETFNANVAGSYAPSSLRAKGKLIEVIEVTGDGRTATYGLQDDHSARALEQLLEGKIPIGALTAFLYRDYGFYLSEPSVERVVDLFREEFGFSRYVSAEQKVFSVLFEDDLADFNPADLEVLY